MPIRFQCDQCGQHLSIARRKAGSQIDCPTCKVSQHVPGEVSAEDPGEQIEEGALEEESLEVELDVEEDREPQTIDRSHAEPPPIPDELDLFKTIDLNDLPEIPPAAGSVSPPPPPVPPQGDDGPSETAPRLPIPWAICAQALLLLTVAVGVFGAGYYLGRQDGATGGEDAPNRDAAIAAETDDGFAEDEVLLEARLLWMPNIGESSGDQAAVFIALPQNRIPPSSLPIAGLQPGSENSPDSQASIAAIRSAGGAFSWAEVDGTVAAVLPHEGRYYLLLVSRQVRRSGDQPIRARDLVEMKQYFAEPEELIGESKYVWLRKEIRVGFPVVEHDFGLDGL